MDFLSLKNINVENFKNFVCKFENNETLSSFILKTNTKTSEYLKNNLTISMKNISYFSNNKSAILLLFKFADDNKLIYGKWYNYSSKADREHLEMMLFQKEIPIVVINSDTNEHYTLFAPNDFSKGIKNHIKKTRKVTMNDFDFNSYVTFIEKDIPCLIKLWNSIEV